MKKRVVRIAKRETKKAQIKAEANGIKPSKAEKMSKTAGKAAVRVATTIVEKKLVKRFGQKIAKTAAKVAKKAGKIAVKKTARKEANIASKDGKLVRSIKDKLDRVGKKVAKQIYKEAKANKATDKSAKSQSIKAG